MPIVQPCSWKIRACSAAQTVNAVCLCNACAPQGATPAVRHECGTHAPMRCAYLLLVDCPTLALHPLNHSSSAQQGHSCHRSRHNCIICTWAIVLGVGQSGGHMAKGVCGWELDFWGCFDSRICIDPCTALDCDGSKWGNRDGNACHRPPPGICDLSRQLGCLALAKMQDSVLQRDVHGIASEVSRLYSGRSGRDGGDKTHSQGSGVRLHQLGTASMWEGLGVSACAVPKGTASKAFGGWDRLTYWLPFLPFWLSSCGDALAEQAQTLTC